MLLAGSKEVSVPGGDSWGFLRAGLREVGGRVRGGFIPFQSPAGIHGVFYRQLVVLERDLATTGSVSVPGGDSWGFLPLSVHKEHEVLLKRFSPRRGFMGFSTREGRAIPELPDRVSVPGGDSWGFLHEPKQRRKAGSGGSLFQSPAGIHGVFYSV